MGKFAKLLEESANETVHEFRDCKLQGKEHQCKTLKRLKMARNTILLTCECERHCKTRNQLLLLFGSKHPLGQQMSNH